MRRLLLAAALALSSSSAIALQTVVPKGTKQGAGCCEARSHRGCDRCAGNHASGVGIKPTCSEHGGTTRVIHSGHSCHSGILVVVHRGKYSRHTAANFTVCALVQPNVEKNKVLNS